MIVIKEAMHYLEDVLGFKVELDSPKKNQGSFYILDAYKFLSIKVILKEGIAITMLLIIPINGVYPGIVTLRKHLTQITKSTDSILVYTNA